MHPAGLAKITAIHADGSWNNLDAVEGLETPPDLPSALAAMPTAADLDADGLQPPRIRPSISTRWPPVPLKCRRL